MIVPTFVNQFHLPLRGSLLALVMTFGAQQYVVLYGNLMKTALVPVVRFPFTGSKTIVPLIGEKRLTMITCTPSSNTFTKLRHPQSDRYVPKQGIAYGLNRNLFVLENGH